MAEIFKDQNGFQSSNCNAENLLQLHTEYGLHTKLPERDNFIKEAYIHTSQIKYD